MKDSPPPLQALFHQLLRLYGPQHWWPGETPFEVMVGAILTQNTAWSNVERAIAELKSASVLDPDGISNLDPGELAALIRPTGYFNIKAHRLQAFCRWLGESSGWEHLTGLDTDSLRAGLLGVHGIGPETADDILLYALERPVFVIDAYTRRILSRLGYVRGDEDYESLRRYMETALPADAGLFNEFHALLVRHAKVACRSRPACSACGLIEVCVHGERVLSDSAGKAS